MSYFQSLKPDQVFCINLKTRPDRLVLIKQELQKVGLSTVRFHQPDKDPRGGKQGVYLSHQHIATTALSENLSYVCIFEDDVKFLPHRLTAISQREMELFLMECSEWDVLYLGHNPLTVQPTTRKGIIRCHSFATHAYILSQAGMKKLVETEYNGTAIDVLYQQQFKCYALEKDIAHQPPDQRSDVDEHSLLFTPDTRYLREGVSNVSLWVQRLMGRVEVC